MTEIDSARATSSARRASDAGNRTVSVRTAPDTPFTTSDCMPSCCHTGRTIHRMRSPSQPPPSGACSLTATSDSTAPLSVIWSFRRILTLLERGERETAEKELMVYLDDAERELLTSTPSPSP